MTVQLSLEVKEEHVPQMELTCLSTIPGFMGHHVRHTDYADHRTQVFLGKMFFIFNILTCVIGRPNGKLSVLNLH